MKGEKSWTNKAANSCSDDVYWNVLSPTCCKRMNLDVESVTQNSYFFSAHILLQAILPFCSAFTKKLCQFKRENKDRDLFINHWHILVSHILCFHQINFLFLKMLLYIMQIAFNYFDWWKKYAISIPFDPSVLLVCISKSWFWTLYSNMSLQIYFLFCFCTNSPCHLLVFKECSLKKTFIFCATWAFSSLSMNWLEKEK